MVFYRGRVPKVEFYINGSKLDSVTRFKYLGFLFTCQLSFSEHLKNINTIAKAKIGYLFGMLPMRSLSLDMVLKIWSVYIATGV